jgi:YVTN family beta-propeller protein
VTNAFGFSVSVIDTASNAVNATVAVGSIPFWLAITPDGTRAYLANGPDRTVSVIDTATNTVIASVAVGSVPFGVAITPYGTRAYVTGSGESTVSVIDTASNTVVDTARVGHGPCGMAMTPGIGPPTNTNQCKKGGWRVFTIPRKFKNQGDCISLVNAGK